MPKQTTYERKHDAFEGGFDAAADFAPYFLEALIMVEIQGRCRMCEQPCHATKVGALCDEPLCGCHA